MLDNPLIDTSIGLLFLFLILALICSAIQEAVASGLGWRAENLREGIAQLLSDSKKAGLADAFYAHPLVSRLARPGQKPSYIPPPVFATVLMDLLRDGEAARGVFEDVRGTVARLPEGSEVRHALLALVDEAGEEAQAVRQRIEAWFDTAMERVSGWYKRKAQLATALIALALTIGLNADAIEVAKRLWVDPTLRATAVANAEALVERRAREEDEARGPISDVVALRAELAEVGYPIGWPQWGDRVGAAGPGAAAFVVVLQTLVGWLLTAAAVSLGAPFWFDLLSRFVRLRGAGGRPERRR